MVYGERAAFGILLRRSTRTAINAYLDGFLPEENVRIRDKPIQFLRGRVRGEEVGQTILSWGDMEKTMGDFKLKTGEGEVRSAEVVGVVGPNATGKTTMVRMMQVKLNLTKAGAQWMLRYPTNRNMLVQILMEPFKIG